MYDKDQSFGDVDFNTGLSLDEVNERLKQGKVNSSPKTLTKSIGQIFLTNTFTLFNAINLVLAFFVVLVGSYQNTLFIFAITCNTIIGIIQELRAKSTIDKLSVISAPHAKVIRDSQQLNISCEDIVLNDILELLPGQQICADCILLHGNSLSVDESLLTGESDCVLKHPNDKLYSGSFVVSGSGRAVVTTIGNDCYANKITNEARKMKAPYSELKSSLNKVIKAVSYIIFPLGAFLFIKQYLTIENNIRDAVVSTVASLVGMIPEGLILLTSVALAVGVIRLGKKKTLVQELACIETLARVDVLCLDKTGTITEGIIKVEDVIACNNTNISDIEQSFKELTSVLNDSNATFSAIRSYFGQSSNWKCIDNTPFNSHNKFSTATFESKGTYIIGAPEIIFPKNDDLKNQVNEFSKKGLRVIALAHSCSNIEKDCIPHDASLMAIVLMSDVIRKDAKQTFDYFAKQGVTLKVISGDNPYTVSAVAKRAGLANADKCIDLSTIDENIQFTDIVEEYTVFARVSPKQKKELVVALQAKGHTVAMTGDGVNDILALKESDCSIALASGCDATKQASQLVLLNSNFSALIYVVAEGRRVVGNIERVASMYLVKTIASILLGALLVFLPFAYPFFPVHFTLVSSLAVGIPSFFLALEPNTERIKGNFLRKVLARTIPSSLVLVLGVLLAQIFSMIVGMKIEQTRTLCVIILAVVSFIVLYKASIPLKHWKIALMIVLIGAFVIAFFFFKPLFLLTPINIEMLLFAVFFFAATWPCIRIGQNFIANSKGWLDSFFHRIGLY